MGLRSQREDLYSHSVVEWRKWPNDNRRAPQQSSVAVEAEAILEAEIILNAKLTCDDAWFDHPAPHRPWHTHDRWSGRVHEGCQCASSNTESIDAAPCQS